MRLSMGGCLALIFGCLALSSQAPAYTADSLAQFQAGRQYQAAHQWPQAVQAYEAALKADPSLTAAYKALGTIYYMAGDHKGALYFYDRYLASNPNDTATKNFADGIRASLGAPAPAQAVAPAAAEAQSHSAGPFIPGFDVRGALIGVYAGAADVDKFYGGYTVQAPDTQTVPGSGLAPGGGVGVDYGLANGFVAGLDFVYGPLRTDVATATEPDPFGGTDSGKQTTTISQYAVVVTPGWRFKFGKAFVLEPRLGLGVMPSSMKLDDSTVYSAQANAAGFPNPPDFGYDASGLGFVIWPEIRGEYLFGQFGLGASLGYIYNTATTMKYTSFFPAGSNAGDSYETVGDPVVYYNSDTATTPTDWALSTQGVTFSIYGVWHFQPLF